jgi:hypothetical protein
MICLFCSDLSLCNTRFQILLHCFVSKIITPFTNCHIYQDEMLFLFESYGWVVFFVLYVNHGDENN